MNGKHLQIALILLLTLGILKFIRGGQGFDIRSVIPFMSGRDISIYDWAGLALLIIVAWGLVRLRRFGKPVDAAEQIEDEYVYEAVEDDEAEETEEDES